MNAHHRPLLSILSCFLHLRRGLRKSGLSLSGAVLLTFLSANATLAYDQIGDPTIIKPKSDVTGAVILFSSAKGWGADETEAATLLSGQGNVVIGFDSAVTLKRMAASADECATLIGEIERASHETQRQLGTGIYHFPVLAGFGSGGALALALAGQIDAQVIDQIVAINPDPAPDWAKKICDVNDPRPFAFPAMAVLGPSSNNAMRNAANARKQAHPELNVVQTDKSPAQALLAAVLDQKASQAVRDLSQQLPLIEMPVDQHSDWFAILYSGDGGWRDLDKDLAAILQKDGMPVVGVDALRYFWTKVTPEKTTADLSAIINAYQEKWGAKKVLLIGYSFGADILPIIIDQLPAEDRAKIGQVSLLGFADHAAFEVTVSGWLNWDQIDALPTIPALKKIDPKLVQCFYGEDDEEDACKTVAGTGIEIIKTKGSHHFDGDYPALAQKILDGVKRR